MVGMALRAGKATTMKKPPTVIVLAAGRGSRFKAPDHKLLQAFGTSTVLGTALEHAIETGLQLRVVTTAAVSAEARRHVARRDIVELPTVTGHSGETLGMGFSIASGVAASADAGGWLILPGDMPSLKPAHLCWPWPRSCRSTRWSTRSTSGGAATRWVLRRSCIPSSCNCRGTRVRAAWWRVIRHSVSRSTIPAC